MLEDKAVLIVEGNVYLALDLCAAVEQLGGRVIGPVDSLTTALTVLDSEQIAAAVVDYELPEGDVTLIVEALSERKIPFVIQSTIAVPDRPAMNRFGAPVLVKPVQAREVISILRDQAAKAA